MIHLQYLEFENGSVLFSKEEFEKLLAEHKRNLHALWMAKAEICRWNSDNCTPACHSLDYDEQAELWLWAERKCLEKAKEFE